MSEKFTLLDKIFAPEMVNAYTLMGLGIITKAAKDPEAQARLESLIKTFADAAEKILPQMPYLVAAYFGWDTGILGVSQEDQNNTTRAAGAGTAVIALKLAESSNLAAGAAGIGYLASLGIIKAMPFFENLMDDAKKAWDELWNKDTITLGGKTYPREQVVPATNVNGVLTCPIGYKLESNAYFKVCVPDTI